MPKPTLNELCALLNVPPLPDGDEPIAGVATDSREVVPGQLFVALKGLQVDGHDFVTQALDKGALGAIVNRGCTLDDPALIRVDDPLLALQACARWHVARSKACVIGVTGSLGKTTTKDFLYTLLKSKYKTACTSGNQNSQVGMAASLLTNVTGDEEFLVVEMGMTEAGHIKKLVDVVPPDMALITYIALVHAENFESIQAIADAKAEICSNPKTRLVLVNKDAPCWERFGSALTYSLSDPEADFFMQPKDDCIKFWHEGIVSRLAYTHFPAPHIYSNALAACSMAFCAGMSIDEISRSLAALQLPERRLQVTPKAGICFINDSYNAAEPSLKAALSYIASLDPQKRKIAVIGQMRELGRFSEGCHKAVGEHAVSCVDKVYCLGEECRPIVDECLAAHKPVKWFCDFAELVSVLKNELEKDDFVLLKGSRSNGLWRVLEHFN